MCIRDRSIGVNGTPASADYAEKMHKVIKACLREIFGDVADEIPVLYGGSAVSYTHLDVYKRQHGI